MAQAKNSKSSKGGGSRTKHEADLKHLNQEHMLQQYNDGSVGVNTPFDMPVFVKAFRLTDEEPDMLHSGNGEMRHSIRTLKGWTLELDAFTFDVKLYVRIGRDGTLRVFAEDDAGMEKVAEWSKQ